MNKHSQSQRERLNYLEFRLYFTGQVSRADLIRRFGISEAAATRDLTVYRDEAGKNLDFDTTTKCYRISLAFEPYYLKEVASAQLLRAVVHGMGTGFVTAPESIVACELPSRMHAPSAKILAAISRAICQKRVLRIEYLSDSGNHGPREIIPFSMAGTGLKWMVRAYCRRKGFFCHFIINRIKTAEVLLDSTPKDEEKVEYDDEWNRMLKLELAAHPSASPEKKAMTELEFCMSEGVYVLRVRAALAGFVLRLWSVDCSENQRLKLLPLCLKNRIALHDVQNAYLAPGYETEKSEAE